MKIIAVLGMAAAVALSPASASASAADWIRTTLSRTASDAGICGVESAAASGTLKRLGHLELPEQGKVIVVNIPSGIVTAYEDGVPVIESKAVVGGVQTQTPEMDTHVTYVRPNPTWTVPQSIIKRKGWLAKLRDNPAFFDDNNFDVMVSGRPVPASEAARDTSAVTGFVQRPGPGNSLGVLKIGIQNDQAIYLHDTNDPGKFESEVRAASAGCVRVEKVRDIAAWILDVPTSQVDAMIDGGDTRNHDPVGQVRVILGYWTAWPDESGALRYYPDIYNLDGKASECSPSRDAAGYADPQGQWGYDEPTDERPRFEPSESGRQARPQWTEYQVR
ncbi:L,D-transpeptidase family protein [Agrobacterium rubi]|nr:L,D-transpeptidase family protein [Agrobacterium rubi]NTF24524.1 L,D-transpeptidase family protein [Agrobacterium rubi]